MSIDCCKSYVGKQIIGLLPSESVEPPVANFSGSPTTIYAGDTVAFTDLSTNSPTSWSWAFAGGTPATSTTQNPSVVYNTVGTYNVDLTASNAGGSDLESKPNYITVINPYLLDNYTGAAAAYSVRKLSSTYAGSALRVRRSSDNTEQDIGFVGLDLDTTALASFVGANNGFVTKWYDQSGNSTDFSQATASLQMKIVNAGTIETSGGKPAIRSLKNTGNRMDNNLSTLQNPPLSIYTCFELVDLSNNQYTNASFIYNGTYSTIDGRYRLGITNSNYITQRWSSITQNNDSFSAKRNIFANLFRSTQIDTYQNLNSYIGTAYSGAIFNSPSTFRIGADFYFPDYFAAGGYYQEFIIYLSDQNTNNTGIRTNINSYFSVY